MDLPEGVHARRVFTFLVLAVGAVLLLSRYLLLPHLFHHSIPSGLVVLDSLLADLSVGVFASALLAWVLFWLIPARAKRAVIDIVPAHERGTELDRARVDTDSWWFSGSTGRYTIAVTLPDLAKRAKEASASKTLVLQVLDPANDVACRAYADYRASVRQGDPSWTMERVKRELYATILSTYAWKREAPLLDITIALKSSASLLRFDQSSRVVIVTKEDPREPALRADHGTYFYNAFREEMRMSHTQGRTLPSDIPGVPRKELTRSSARALLVALNLDSGSVTDLELDAIVELVKRPENPYA